MRFVNDSDCRTRVHFVRRRARKKISDGLAGDPMDCCSNFGNDGPRAHSTLAACSQIQHHARGKPADESQVFSIRKCADRLGQMKRKRIGAQSRDQSKLAGGAFGEIAWSIASRQSNDIRIAGSSCELDFGRENVPREPIADLDHAADIPDGSEFSTDQFAQDVLGACPTRATGIAFRQPTHLIKRDSVGSPTLRVTDGKKSVHRRSIPARQRSTPAHGHRRTGAGHDHAESRSPASHRTWRRKALAQSVGSIDR